MPFVDKKLKQNEQLIIVFRRYWLTHFKAMIWPVLIIITDFFLLFPLFDWGTTGQIIFSLILFVALVLLVRVLILIKYNLIIITDERIIRVRQNGLFDRLVTEIDIDQITEALFRVKGFWQTIFKYGTVLIRILDQDKPIFLKHLKHPETVQQLILNTQKYKKTED